MEDKELEKILRDMPFDADARVVFEGRCDATYSLDSWKILIRTKKVIIEHQATFGYRIEFSDKNSSEIYADMNRVKVETKGRTVEISFTQSSKSCRLKFNEDVKVSY